MNSDREWENNELKAQGPRGEIYMAEGGNGEKRELGNGGRHKGERRD